MKPRGQQLPRLGRLPQQQCSSKSKRDGWNAAMSPFSCPRDPRWRIQTLGAWCSSCQTYSAKLLAPLSVLDRLTIIRSNSVYSEAFVRHQSKDDGNESRGRNGVELKEAGLQRRCARQTHQLRFGYGHLLLRLRRNATQMQARQPIQGAVQAVLQAASHSPQCTLGKYATRTGRNDTVSTS